MADARSRADVVVVADLHMSSGRDPATGAPSRSEDFHSDGPFVRFLDWRLRHGRARGREWRLLILGDFLDFTRVALGGRARDRRRLDMSQAAALAKLERIRTGHPEVFRALRRLAQAGVAIDIVAGNHDLELLQPPVQARLRAMLDGDRSLTSGAVAVHPWIFHLPGVLYAEHGHQHHDINRVPGGLGGDAGRVGPPLGSELAEWISEVVDAGDPRGPLEPSFRRLAAVVRERPAALAAAWPAHLRLLRALSRFVLARRAGALCRDGELVRAALAADAAAVRLRPRTLAELEALGASSPAATAARLLRLALSRIGGGAASPGPVSGEADGDYMRAAAAAAHRVLTAAGEPAASYVFAHTHVGDLWSLPGAFPATYLNTGTWSSLRPDPSFGCTFVEVDGTRRGGLLRAWDDRRRTAHDLAAGPSILGREATPGTSAGRLSPERQRA